MKKIIHLTALLGLLLGSSSLLAESNPAAKVTYGPVITVKPKGAHGQPAESKSKPGTPDKVANDQNKPRGLLLPAVQKVRESAARSKSDAGDKQVKSQNKGEPIQGALDRDIIRRIPSPQKPKPK